jgi:hypothetical protein
MVMKSKKKILGEPIPAVLPDPKGLGYIKFSDFFYALKN